MAWEVEVTDEFQIWWNGLTEPEQSSVRAVVKLLVETGPNLAFHFRARSTVRVTQLMRELRIQHRGTPHRILYIFDPRRVAILLIGGNKRGDDRWYEKIVPAADRIYDEYLKEAKEDNDA